MQKLFHIPHRISLFTVAGALACFTLHGQDYEITEAPFNSEEADFSGSFNGNQFVFSSTRAKTNLSFLEDTITININIKAELIAKLIMKINMNIYNIY